MFKVSQAALAAALSISIEAASSAGCYPAYSSSSTYSSGSLVSFNSTNYECVHNHYSVWCTGHQPPGEPGSHATVAWLELGPCSGAQDPPAPTSKPTPPLVTEFGGACPAAFAPGTEYAAGDRVERNGFVFECRGTADIANWCGAEGYEPETGMYWENAWKIMGTCRGLLPPTASPTIDPDAPGCPPVFDQAATYKSGDRVSVGSLSYECKRYPWSAFCGLANFEPGSSNSDLGWILLGSCDGTLAPTTAPTLDPNSPGCPAEYSPDGDYQAGDRVSVGSTVYQCKTDGNSPFCLAFGPEHERGGSLGWEKLSSCQGTVAPTAAPSFDPATPGCPESWAEGTPYQAGDRVSVSNSIYECDALYHAHCTFREPGTVPDDESWNKKGSCEGTIAPTSTPTLDPASPGCPASYDPSTPYAGGDAVEANGLVYQCRTDAYGAYCNAGPEYAPGSPNSDRGWVKMGSCFGTIAPTSSPTHAGPDSGGCNHPWRESDLESYAAGARVEYNQFLFECKSDVHLSKYCKDGSYGPNGMYWDMAWNKVGWCDGTLAPTKSPSSTPSVDPSTVPSAGPSLEPSGKPSAGPSAGPSDAPSSKPSAEPSEKPSLAPSDAPSSKPSAEPSEEPSLAPSDAPSELPSDRPA